MRPIILNLFFFNTKMVCQEPGETLSVGFNYLLLREKKNYENLKLEHRAQKYTVK